MKFNEKLIELRRKQGLSQEELGYKLNVTRQTVSKWELGQTTPEMDKLSEISKIFNVSVDQLINDSEIGDDRDVNPINNKIEDQPIQEKGSKVKTILIVVFALVMIWLLIRIVFTFIGLNIFKKVSGDIFDSQGQFVNQAIGMAGDLYNTATNKMEEQNETTMNPQDILNNFTNGFSQAIGTVENTINSNSSNQINQIQSQVSVKAFNNGIELYAGTSNPLFATTMLDNIITSNKTNNKKITVKYDKTETQDETKIRNIKQTINKMQMMQQLEVTCEYDAEGYIYKVIIEKI